MAVELQRIAANGVEFGYFRFGQGDRKLVVIPGLSVKSVLDFKDSVAVALKTFGKVFEVYVFDRRENLPNEYTIEDMAKDFITAFDALGLDKISLYGISQGGMIALNIAILRPDMISAMVIGSSAARLSEYTQKTIGEWNKLARNKDEDTLLEAFGSKVYTKEFYERFKDIIINSVKGVTDEEFNRLVILTDNINDFDVYDRLTDIRCPVLVMGGSEDQVTGIDSSREIAEKLNCESVVYEGYGHAVYDENEEFKAKAKEFLLKSLI